MSERFPNVIQLDVGKKVRIGEDVEIRGGHIVIEDGVCIRQGTKIHVTERLVIGRDSIIGESNRIFGRNIRFGREAYTNHNAEIGGGSCFEDTSSLEIGYWFHQGSYGMINTAMPVRIGNEVGLGRFTNLYTHGAYQSALQGYPVSFAPITLGDNVWIPGATVNPGVTIGDNVVVAVGAILSRDLPSGCLAGGVPCRVLKEQVYPSPLDPIARDEKIEEIARTFDLFAVRRAEGIFEIEGAVCNLNEMSFKGRATEGAERGRKILRRHGIRFKVEIEEGRYTPWK